MKRKLKTLIAGLIVMFFLAITIPLVVAQTSPSPHASPSASQSNGAPVVLGDETLFFIQAPQSGLSPQQRAQRLSQRLRDFAYDQSLPLEMLCNLYQLSILIKDL